jgi:antitoxin (DNA-binding transcriptional repressor) of toxin-antitoxin stability system
MITVICNLHVDVIDGGLMNTVTVEVATTELARHLGDYLARVRYGGNRIVVVKNNTRVAELRALPPESCDLRKFLDVCRTVPVDAGFADDLDTVSHADRPAGNPWA